MQQSCTSVCTRPSAKPNEFASEPILYEVRQQTLADRWFLPVAQDLPNPIQNSCIKDNSPIWLVHEKTHDNPRIGFNCDRLSVRKPSHHTSAIAAEARIASLLNLS